MNELQTTEMLVKSILEVDKQARNSDSILYLRVLEQIAWEEGICLDMLSVVNFLNAQNRLPFPPFESVRRSRQKIQAAHFELASDKRIAKLRKEKEAEYKAYALERGSI